ncbi:MULTISPECIES: YhgE/Pip family protein [Streptomycetaceae]|uniref:ABC-2 type transporter transmembrane domain-containing protein n=1 Tax=Streptantibioticus cattleyicolor (strain ATCC 35852 / DSM 46488 / JCM 4925 / NBRC 14057 / NRRL 8057) TaxID=1003195 RepID=F8JZZ8_STREN|nr:MULTISPECIES: YhgE/Pip domain-containing protein [Streptomycetaceae]AEW93591.1 hypothetical protein SCATT_12200 [Streptantibioticus cattleyicolor NRRL 8057 = DSM 46488]MYS58295.1 ABC transporter permease [Streptomyces sp. SID5468]CCB73941.1 putative ABC transporter permease protein [Streptantibioticus cattleyicolor NRRL 8057 = DSM 46488]
MRAPRLAALELRKFGRGKLPVAALVALLLPLLYGALYLCSFWDPYGRLDKVPVALVDEDKGATVKGERIAAGDEIVKKLRANRSKSFNWVDTNAQDAAKGVENGTYYLSLTIPADFSHRVASSGGDDPQTGALQVRTNDANNYIVGQISRTVFSEVRSAASATASRGFYDKIFLAFSDIHDKTRTAADGAAKLNDGLGKAKDGAAKLNDGLTKAKQGSGELVDGLGTAKQGSGQLADGLGTAKQGSGKLAGGLDTLESGSAKVAAGAHEVADGTQQLADKVGGLADTVRPVLKNHSQEIADAARLVADGSRVIRENLAKLPQAAAQADSDAQSAYDDLSAAYQRQCGGAAGDVKGLGVDCAALKKAVDAAQLTARVAHDVHTVVQNDTDGLRQLDGDLASLQQLAGKLADDAPHLSSDLDNAVRQINQLNSGAHQVASGADRVHAGNRDASTGANALDGGLGKLENGGNALDNGIGKLRNGGNALNSGIGDLSTGAQSLSGGLYKLSDGSNQLATGLADGVRQIPDYGKDARTQRAGVMADPVRLAAEDMHKAPNYGTGFAPYFIPLSLWVGAMVAYMLMQPLSRRALAAGASGWRIALAGWLPVAGIGVLQSAALLSVLHWAIGLQMVRAAGTVGFLLLVVACFTTLVQWCNARFGPAGRVLVLALLMLQLTSAGGTYPVQTSPAFFNWIHPFLPMSYVVDGLRHLITGGDMWPVWRACLVLAAFTAGALTLTAWTARRKQVWTVDRLHPEISL